MIKKLKFVLTRLLPPVVTTLLWRIMRASPYKPRRVATSTPELPQGAAILKEAWSHIDATANLSGTACDIPASKRWAALLERMRNDIGSFTTAQEAIHFAQTGTDFENRAPVQTTAHLFQLHAETLKNEFPHFAQLLDTMGDSPFSTPATMLRAHGQLVSTMFFLHMSYLLQCLTWVPRAEVVCEIGSGYGSLARLWLLNPIRQPKTYVLVDFPESLFFAEVFLRSNFDGVAVHYVMDSKPLEANCVNQHRIILCPIHYVEALSSLSIDLVINTGSMQEMTEEWIDFWMGWLRRQQCRFFYSLNYFGQPLNYMAEGNNTWSPRLTPEWTVRLQKSNPAFVMQLTVRNFAEILAEKTGITPLATHPALLSRYDEAKQRVLHGQALLECMDIVRLEPGEEVLWDLLQRIMQLKTLPKEAYFIAEHLTKNASEDFRREHGKRLAEILELLQRVRAGGVENIHSPPSFSL